MSLANFFNPLSVAVVGASRDANKIGTIVVQNLLAGGYAGTIYPINPHTEEILGLPVYPTLADCPVPPELVVISLPAAYVLDILHQIIEQKIHYVVILTAGFKEIGVEGAQIEQQIEMLIKEHGLTLLGPNCLGFVSATNHLNATFANVEMCAGSLKVISQSGAIASSFFDRASSAHLGIDACVTVGNKAGIDENDLLDYWNEYANAGDPIGMYLESIDDGYKFLQITRELTKKNPVFLLKPGRSFGAQKAMQSHTGSIAGEDHVLTAACKQAGVIRCETIEEFFDLSVYFSRQPAPRGPRVAIISNAGGPAVITTDLLDAYGLEIAQLAQETQNKLTECLPRAASVHDPVDLLGDAPADRYAKALQVVLDDEADVDAIIVILTPQIMTEIKKTAEKISELAKQHSLPIVCAFIGNHHVREGQSILHHHQLPCFSFPEKAVYALAQAYNRYVHTQQRSTSTPFIEPLPTQLSFPDGSGLCSAQETTHLLNQVGIGQPPTQLIDQLDQARKFTHTYGYPVVMKLTGKELLHKQDLGGVMTDIWNDDLLEESFSQLSQQAQQLQYNGQQTFIQLQQQIQDGLELIVGYKKDPTFGDMLMIGSGGSLTNLLSDHQIGIFPLTKNDLQQLLQQTALRTVLQGYRGHPAYAIDQLLTFLEGFVQLVQTTNRIDQAEINPIIVTTQGVYAVDPKIVLL